MAGIARLKIEFVFINRKFIQKWVSGRLIFNKKITSNRFFTECKSF